MKVIVAGSRTISDLTLVAEAIRESGFEITEVVSGGAMGVDRAGERWAKNAQIPVRQFIPDWKREGKRAGFIRNRQMAEYADALVAVWDGKSRGTEHMIREAKRRVLKIYVAEPSERR